MSKAPHVIFLRLGTFRTRVRLIESTRVHMAKRLDFESVVANFYEPLFQFALSLTRAEPDACDLTQHTFYVWAAKGHQLRDPNKTKTWLFTTMHRAFLVSRRWHMRFPHYGLEDVFSELQASSPISFDQLDREDVSEALGKLEEIYRRPVALFYLQERSYKEITDILNIPIGTVKSRIFRGIARLRVILEPDKPRGSPAITGQKAKQILNLYRPGTDDALDPAFSEALDFCERDNRLIKWLEQHCANYSALRDEFRQIPVPQGFKEQIIAECAFLRKKRG